MNISPIACLPVLPQVFIVILLFFVILLGNLLRISIFISCFINLSPEVLLTDVSRS